MLSIKIVNLQKIIVEMQIQLYQNLKIFAIFVQIFSDFTFASISSSNCIITEIISINKTRFTTRAKFTIKTKSTIKIRFTFEARSTIRSKITIKIQ